MRRELKVVAALALMFVAVGCGTKSASTENNPKACDKAVVVAGNARFTVLTPEMIRMEWSEDGKFEDRATLTIVNRALDVPEFAVEECDKALVITTDKVKLTYQKGEKFSAENLKAEFEVAGEKQTWHYGDVDSLNLMGTTRTLDGYYSLNHPKNRKKNFSEMETGLLSRSGWSVIDDSSRHILAPVESHWKQWVECRPEGERQDLYLLAYGHDYKKALKDYTRIAGDIPMPPKYTFGYWWSRYWQYSDNELRDLVETMQSFDIPLDVLIVDMDWHETWGLRRKGARKDEYGQRIGWTGYTWKQQLFPDPKNFMDWCHDKNLKVSLNLHPASGIQPFEEPYERFIEAYEWQDKGKSVPYKMSEEKWADAYFKSVLVPFEQDGIDFWWLDWQQWVLSKYVKDLNNTFWLNHTFYHHMAQSQPERRPMIYHRWGGLGSHRYQVGFSGDIYIAWDALAFLPWFTATASNVGYGYWGHDIGGHMYHSEDPNITNPEMYLRWLQYGVFTPIFKTHCTKNAEIERRIWHFPDHMKDMRATMHLRYALVPYIYRAARQTYETGVSMCRPMYYDYPECELAYALKDQHMFGDDILVAPIVSPINEATGLAERKVWLPKGTSWYNMATGKMYEGNDEEPYTIHSTLAENNYFVKAGTIIPMYPSSVRNLQATLNSYVLTFVPGGDGKTTIYEDDGESDNYKSEYATIDVSKQTKGNKVVIKIAPRKGDYKGAMGSNTYELRLPASFPPQRVVVDGRELDYARYAKEGQWSYDGYELASVIYVGEVKNSRGCTVEIEYAAEDMEAQPSLYGFKGVVNRCLKISPELKMYYAKYYDPYPLLPDFYMNVSQAPNFIVEKPCNIHALLEQYNKSYEECIVEIGKMEMFPEEYRQRLTEQLTKF